MKLEKILLLSCRSPFLDDSKIYAPMANLYLKSYINEKVKDVEVILGDDEYELIPEYFKPYDLIGISIMTPQREEAEKIIKTIKNYPEKKIVIGGPHIKHYCSEVIKWPVDWIVPLDGEKAIVGILKNEIDFSHKYIRTSLKINKENIQKIAMEEINDPRILVNLMTKEEIANAPRPDRTSYNSIKIIKNYHYKLGNKESTTMMSARGCPEQCAFCEDAMTPVKWSSIESIKNQLDDIVSLGYKGVYMFDDLFAIALPKIKPICEELKKRDLIYRCNAQARYFTKWGEEMAKLLSETGCYEIAFGAESGSQKILDNINKRTTIENNYKTIELANKYGIIVKAFILLGLPGEDKNTLKETEKFIDYLMQNPKNDFGCYIYYPYRGTQLRDAIDRNEDIGLTMLMSEGLGAYGQKGGNTESILNTENLLSEELLNFRDYLINKYKPESSKVKWQENQKYRQE